MKQATIRSILVPIDFSPMSIAAIATARSVAQKSGAIIHLAHVHHAQYPVGFRGPVLSQSEYAISFEEHRKEALLEDLQEAARRQGLARVSDVHLCEGVSVYREICRLALRIRADLIVMPTHGRTALGHVFLGSTAERVVQHAPCPVLITRPRAKEAKRIPAKKAASRRRVVLVPVDFSGASLDALEYAIDFTAGTPTKLLILHVVDLGDALSTDGLGVYRMSDVREVARAEAERRMDDLPSRVDLDNVSFECLIRNGKPVSEICALADARDVDLIIGSTHGRTGLEHLFLGSVAEQVVRYASRSVLIVPAHPAPRAKSLTQVVRRGRSRAMDKADDLIFAGHSATGFTGVRL